MFIYTKMKYVKTFEEMWPFKKESESDKNKKNLISICIYILDFLSGKKLIGYRIKRVEVGYSKSKENIFIIQLFTDTEDIIRFNFKINSDFKIVDFYNYYVIKEGKMSLHSLKQKMDRANLEDYVELNDLLNKINEFFKSNKLFI